MNRILKLAVGAVRESPGTAKALHRRGWGIASVCMCTHAAQDSLKKSYTSSRSLEILCGRNTIFLCSLQSADCCSDKIPKGSANRKTQVRHCVLKYGRMKQDWVYLLPSTVYKKTKLKGDEARKPSLLSWI